MTRILSVAGARSVTIIIIGHEVQNLNEAVFHIVPWERYETSYSPACYGLTAGQTGIFNLAMATSLGEEKIWIQSSCIFGNEWAHPGYLCLRLTWVEPPWTKRYRIHFISTHTPPHEHIHTFIYKGLCVYICVSVSRFFCFCIFL